MDIWSLGCVFFEVLRYERSKSITVVVHSVISEHNAIQHNLSPIHNKHVILFFSLHPLFPGSNEVDQIAKIHDVLGTPPQSILQKLTKYNTKIFSNY